MRSDTTQVSSVAAARSSPAGPSCQELGAIGEALVVDEDEATRSGVGSPLNSSSSRTSSSSRARSSAVTGSKAQLAGMPTSLRRPAPLQSQIDEFMAKHDIQIQCSSAEDVPTPVLSMDQAPFHSTIMKSVRWLCA